DHPPYNCADPRRSPRLTRSTKRRRIFGGSGSTIPSRAQSKGISLRPEPPTQDLARAFSRYCSILS
ncbi:hypothetical protein C8R44DRAFT_766816, partial [Mycena epipterygia]